jgi:GT2 family glycosyltransferase
MIPMMVVPTLTRHDLLANMLASVDYPVKHLVVIDNSGRGIVGGSGPWERMTVLPMPVNFGVAASWNLALKMAHKEPYVLITSDDVTFPPGSLAAWDDISSEDAITLTATWPNWCTFTIGARIVHRVGVFDEGYFPAYFEDNDYARRMARADVNPLVGPAVLHSNSSTLNTPNADFANANHFSFVKNRELFESDQHCGFNPYRWRANAWT